MSLLNDPIGYDDESKDAEWTPEIGLRRGIVQGGLVAVGIGALLVLLSIPLPAFFAIWMVRVPLTAGLTFVLFKAVARFSGMVSVATIGLTLALVAVTLLISQVGYVFIGMPNPGEEALFMPVSMFESFMTEGDGGRFIGWGWLHPYAVLLETIVPLVVGGGFGVAISRAT